MISERFHIEDFSVNTVNNFFSERSKATTIYTTGYICSVLNISIDAVFGIEQQFSTEEELNFVRQLQEVKAELRLKEQRIESLEEKIAEKDTRLNEAHTAIEHYRSEIKAGQKKVPSWIFTVILVLLICSLIFIAVYLIVFDLNNPMYGIFRDAASQSQNIFE